MTSVSASNMSVPFYKGATYNAIKIQINDPKTIIPEKVKTNPYDDGTYNAVNIEVNRPSVEKEQKSFYDYPQASYWEASSNDRDYSPITIPQYPYTYQTNNFVNNRTLINAEFEYEDKLPNKVTEEKADEVQIIETPAIEENNGNNMDVVLYEEKFITVPEPNVTSLDDEKVPDTNISFNGAPKTDVVKKEIEIIPSVDITPTIDVPKVIENLSNENFDVQAIQMEEIAKCAKEDKTKLKDYLVTEIFSELIKIATKNTTELTPPTEKQLENREKFIINRIVEMQAEKDNKKLNKEELPYQLTEAEIKQAIALSPMEQAERNIGYAMSIIAILAKTYADDVQQKNGDIIPLTDLPGISEIVDNLRRSQNTEIKVSAIEALYHIRRSEYNEELKSIFELASKDSNPYVSAAANFAIEKL